MDYEELETKDLRAVSYWCFFLMYIYFSHIVFNIVADVYPNQFMDVEGGGLDSLFGLIGENEGKPKMFFMEAIY